MAESKNKVCPECSGHCKYKKTPRDEETRKKLLVRLNRVGGQIEGIKKMVDENRYCADILIQLSACKSALESIGFILMEDHLRTCVADEIASGNKEITGEVIELIKKL